MQRGKVNTDEYGIEDLLKDKKKVQKWIKRAEKGDVNHREAYHIAKHLVAASGRPSLEFSVDQTRKKGGHDLQISELRDLITCILYDQPTNASGFKMSNKSYMRFVLIIHIEGIADGRTFQHKMRLGEEVHRLRISQTREHMTYLPYKLLTYEDDPAQSAKKKQSGPSIPVDTDPRPIYDRLLAYCISIGQQRLWNYPQIVSPSSVTPDSNHASSHPPSPPFTFGKRPVSLLHDGGESKRARVEESDFSASVSLHPQPCLDSQVFQGIPSQGEAHALFLSSSALQPVSICYYDDFPINQQRIEFHDFLRTVSRTSAEYASLFPPTLHPALRSAITPLSIAAIDCEMVDTVLGREVVRITLLARAEDDDALDESVERLSDLLSSSTDGRTRETTSPHLCPPTSPLVIPPRDKYRGYDVIMDCLVQPAGQVVDYCTQFSGIDAKSLQGVTTTLQQAQIALCRWITTETILIGHSIDSDLKALHLYHPCCIDTALLFPHARGFPMRRKLRHLAEDCLHMSIQSATKASGAGHDSREDAHAALLLAITKAERGDAFGPKFTCRRSMLRQYQERDVQVYMVASQGSGGRGEEEEGRTKTEGGIENAVMSTPAVSTILQSDLPADILPPSSLLPRECPPEEEAEEASNLPPTEAVKLVNCVPRCTGRGFPFGLEDVVDGDAHMVRVSLETLTEEIQTLLSRSSADNEGEGYKAAAREWTTLRELNQHAIRVDPPRLVCVSVVCDKETPEKTEDGSEERPGKGAGLVGEKEHKVLTEVSQLVRSLQVEQPRGKERHGLVIITSQNSMKKAQGLLQRKRASMLPMSSVVWTGEKEAQLKEEVASVNNGFVSFVVV